MNKKIRQAKKAVSKVQKPKYNYICPACTQYAFSASNKDTGFTAVCGFCQKEFTVDNKDNFVPFRA